MSHDAKLKMIQAIKNAYSAVDTSIAGIPKPCQEGCSHCCRQPIRVHPAEELVITEYATKAFSPELRKKVVFNLKKWFSVMNANTPKKSELSVEDVAAFEELHRHKEIPCPFLVDDGCAIYPARPVTCRSFYVLSDPGACRKDPVRLGEPKGYEAGARAFAQISELAGFGAFRLLPYSVAEYFGVKGEIQKAMPFPAQIRG